MKTLFSILLATCISAGAFAQFEQGTMLVGGSFGFEATTNKSKQDNTTSTNGKSTSFSLDPNVGYFVINNLAVGASLGLGLTTIKADGSDAKATSTSITFGPFVRYYFKPGIFLESKFGLGSMKVKQEYGGDSETYKYALSGWSLGAGYALFLNDNVALEPIVGYQSNGRKDKSDGAEDVKNISSGLFLRLGFQIYLR